MAINYRLYVEAIFTSTRIYPCSIFCDLDSEKPTSGLIPGDRVYCIDSQKFYKATGPTTLVEIGGTGGSPTWGNIGGDITDQTDLDAALDGKAPTSHAHAQSDVTNLITDLAGKLATSSFDGLTKITVSPTQPVAPSTGDLWIQT